VRHSSSIDPDVEAQANDFAAEFLMPSHIIDTDLRNLTPARLLALKKMWGVSMQGIFEHAYRLGKVTSAERAMFYRMLNARGWKRTEPGSDQITLETPQLAQAIGRTLLERGGMNRDEVARLTARLDSAKESTFLPPDTRLRVM
jgi:Zn-dependent peptidase ImmA (M78 family)